MKGFRFVFLLLGVFFSALAIAFPCYMTLVKDSCWANYNVTVKVNDTSKEKVIATINVPEDKQWVRTKFECEPKQTLMLIASFMPAFWKADEGKEYPAKRYWALPETIVGKTRAWNMNICYPADFSAVPLPPDASGKCACDMTKVPSVKPVKD